MELDERPTEQYSDVGGLDKQIEEVVDCRPTVVDKPTECGSTACLASLVYIGEHVHVY